MICGGPILLIVGIVVLVTPNTRDDEVQQYNDVVNAYNLSASDDWSSASGTIAGSAASLQTDIISVTGSSDGVDAASSRYARAFMSNPPTTVSYAISNIAPFSRTVSYSVSQTNDGKCDRDRCYSGNGVCPSYAIFNGPDSCIHGTCGTCTHTNYVSTFCQVVKKSGSQWVDDPNKKCFYKNDAKFTTSAPSTVEFQVRQSGDPYIALQRITEGDNDFGPTHKQQLILGIVLVAGGCVMVACIFVVVYVVYRLVKEFIIVDDDETGTASSNNRNHQHRNNQEMEPHGQDVQGQPVVGQALEYDYSQ